ncbi:hypothetical protein [Synechocystis sp. LKSZ1]|uniref:hypothetical protein n=1 Tax=Synechocystis sp. LKSZ1 TaxID=3144951 RepID=UPI00336C1118
MTIGSVLIRSPHDSFITRRLTYNCVICEAMGGDIYNWGNSTDEEPAFILYLGVEYSGFKLPKDTVEEIVSTYGASEVTIRKPKHLKEFDYELKIRGIYRNQLDEFLYRFCCPF